MQFQKGARLGPYEIVDHLGAGGMGEVYRARDTRLGRVVALKILTAAVSENRDVRVRFEREARAIAALAHPNICALHDVGDHEGIAFIVMECLEGETLARRIARGPLPLPQVVRYGAEIAEALHQAHRHGIVHRDVKPGNIMITSGGAKLLDFGLAHWNARPIANDSDASATTQIVPLTAEGTILGTLHYMSPEQVEQKETDHRSDLFSLGVVLYEMVTGCRPFEGTSRASIVAAILSSDPVPVRSLQPAVPPALDHIISVALEKDREQRWQSAQDVARQLRWIDENAHPSPESVTSPRRRWLTTALLVAAAAVVAVVTWMATRHLGSRRGKAEPTQLEIALPPYLTFPLAPETEPFAISPDGRTLAVVASRAGMTSLYVRDLRSPDVHPVEGSEGAASPFWSSDGRWLGFSARGKLWKTRVTGGARPEPICNIAAAGARASWVGDTILFAEAAGGRPSIRRISSGGGEIAEVLGPNKAEMQSGCSWPQLLPDGRHFLYLLHVSNSPERRLMMGTLGSMQRSLLAIDVSHARAFGNDRIVYVREGKLLSQHVDTAKGVMTGESSTIAENVSWYAVTGKADFDVAANGTVVYASDTRSSRIVLSDRRGNERLIDDKGPFLDLAIAPDGKRAAVSVLARETSRSDIWIYDLDRGTRDRFTSEPGTEVTPFWSPDGRMLVYSAETGELPRLVRRELSGGPAQNVVPNPGFQFGGSFTPDGSTVYYHQRDPRRRSDIFRVPLAPPARPQLVIGTEFNERDPRVSSDGKWLAFTADSTGDFQIYLHSLTTGEHIRISGSGGQYARWRRDAQELFYVAPQGIVSAVPATGGDWHHAVTTTMFPLRGELEGFDVAPDGQSFLLSVWTPGPSDHLIHVVTGAIAP